MNLNDRRSESPQTNSPNTMDSLKALLQEKSSENMKLQAALQDATKQVQTMNLENLNLKAKLQEQTEREVNYEKKIASLEDQIAMMSESDEFWKRAKQQERKNEEESKQLDLQRKELEQKQLQQRTEQEKKQNELEEKKADLVEEEDRLNQKRDELDGRERSIAEKEETMDAHIQECAENMIASKKRQMETEYASKIRFLESKHERMKEDLEHNYKMLKRRFESLEWGCFLFCIMIFLYEMLTAEELNADVISFLSGTKNLVLGFGSLALTAGKTVGAIAGKIPQETVANIADNLVSAIIMVLIIGGAAMLFYNAIKIIIEAFMEHMGDKLSLGVAIYGITTIAFFSSYIKEWVSWNYVGLYAVFYLLYIGLRALLQMENEKVQMTIIKCLIGAGGVLGAIKFFIMIVNL